MDHSVMNQYAVRDQMTLHSQPLLQSILQENTDSRTKVIKHFTSVLNLKLINTSVNTYNSRVTIDLSYKFNIT